MTKKLRITLFGSIQVRTGEKLIEQYRSESARALLFYLAMAPAGPHHRSVLATLFWPKASEKHARNNLRQILTRLRQALNRVEPTLSHELLTSNYKTVTLKKELIWCDAVKFQTLITAVAEHSHPDLYTCPICWEQLQQAAKLFKGEFLNGFHLSGSAEFNVWQDKLREHYHMQTLLALDTLLVMAHQRGKLTLVQQLAQQQLALEPWREEGQRHLIWALTQLGETEAAIRQYEQFKTLLQKEFGVEPEAETTALYRQIRSTAVVDLPNPYRGLKPFTEANAAFFYGRERYVVRLQALLQEQDFLTVIGPSGSGKSSLVQGGLLPRLRARTTSQEWIIVQSRPGKRPFHNLIDALKPLFPTREHKLLARLATGNVSLLELARKTLKTRRQNGRLLLYIDQFEELFTLVPHKKNRERFIDLLLEAQTSPLPITIILTMRADFMAEALAYPSLAEMTQRGLFLLGGMTNEEMQQTITLPAQKLHVTFEPGLVARLLHDVGKEPGQLPLLQFALTELWERRNHGQITHAAYDDIGGLSGALANYADSIYNELAQSEQTEVRRLFFRLVRPGEQAADTRQVVSSDRLNEEQWQLVQRLANTRLLVTDQESSGNYTVELVHEALIQYWERLQEWLNSDKTFRIWTYRLQTAVGHWEALDEDEGVLLRGLPLAEAEQWFQERDADLGNRSKRFISASLALRAREEATAAAQQARERAFTLTLQAQLALQQGDALKARQFAQAANRIDDPPPATQRLLSETAYMPSTRWRIVAHEGAVLALTTSPDQQTFLSAGADGVINWYEVETQLCRRRFSAHQASVHCVAFSPNGETAVSGDASGQLLWWQLATGKVCQQIAAHTGSVEAVAFLPDGKMVLTAGADRVLRLWDMNTGTLKQTFTGHRGAVNCLDVTKDGRLALSGSADRRLLLWEVATGNILQELGGNQRHVAQQMIKQGHFGTVSGVAFHPNEQSAISVGMDRGTIIWNLTTGDVANYLQFDTPLLDIDVNAIGNNALIGTISSQACLCNLYTNQIVRRLRGHQQRIQAVSFVGTSQAVTGSTAGIIHLWRLHSGAEERSWLPTTDERLTGFALRPDGQEGAGGFDNGMVELWDVASGRTIRRWQAHNDSVARHCQFSPDGRFLVTGSGNIFRPATDTTVKVWDVATGRELFCFDYHDQFVWKTAFSPNGRFVLSTAHDGRVYCASLVDGSSRVLYDFSPYIALGIDISPDARFAALSMGRGHGQLTTSYPILIVDIETGQIVRRLAGHSESIDMVRFAPNGRCLLSGGHDNKVVLWDLGTGEKRHELLGHRGATTVMDFHPSKPFAVSAAAENHIIVWDLSRGTELRRWEGHDNLVEGLSFTPNGNHVISASSDNTIRVWRFDETKEDVLRWLGDN
ncbi:MAG: BTAD domain-containing putative transcriptional regulator [Chloroflexota bacterium]